MGDFICKHKALHLIFIATGSGSKAGALTIKPKAAALAAVFGAGQLRGACWSRNRTSLLRPALCLLLR